jgi:hypothetical protein
MHGPLQLVEKLAPGSVDVGVSDLGPHVILLYSCMIVVSLMSIYQLAAGPGAKLYRSAEQMSAPKTSALLKQSRRWLAAAAKRRAVLAAWADERAQQRAQVSNTQHIDTVAYSTRQGDYLGRSGHDPC